MASSCAQSCIDYKENRYIVSRKMTSTGVSSGCDEGTMMASVADGGYGWVIVAASFYYHLSAAGSLYSISVFYGSWVDDFKTGRGVTAWIISLAMAICVSTGPVSALLGSRYGYRLVTISGSIIMSFGYLLSYFASSVYYLMVSIGVIYGFGMGLGYLPATAAVHGYFRKKRAIAVGIASSGVGVGAFIMPPFLTWLEEIYSWRGSMLILSGIILNMCVGGALMRPPECNVNEEDVDFENIVEVTVETNDVNGVTEWGTEGSINDESIYFLRNGNSIEFSCNGTVPLAVEGMAKCLPLRPENDCEDHRQMSNESYSQCPSPSVQVEDASCMLSSDSCYKRSKHSLKEEIHKEDITKDKYSSADIKYDPESVGLHKSNCNSKIIHTDPRVKCLQGQNLNDLGGSFQHISLDKEVDVSCHRKFSSVHELRSSPARNGVMIPRRRNDFTDKRSSASGHNMDFMLSGSIYNVYMLHKSLNSIMNLNNKGSPSHIPLNGPDIAKVLSDADTADFYDERAAPCCLKMCKSMEVFRGLMRNPGFLSVAFCNLLTNLSFMMPVVYIIDRAVDSGIAKSSAALALSMYGAGNLFGRIFIGWLADRSFVDTLVCYIICLLSCGAATSLSPLCGSELSLHAIYGLVFGIFIGGYVTLTSLVLVDIVGVELVGQSYGLVLAFQGVATAIGTPLAGWMFDWTQSYSISFIIHGIFIILAALMLVPLKVNIWKKEKLKSQEKILAQE